MEALSALIGIEIDADDTRRSLSVIRTLKKCVTSPDVRACVLTFTTRFVVNHSSHDMCACRCITVCGPSRVLCCRSGNTNTLRESTRVCLLFNPGTASPHSSQCTRSVLVMTWLAESSIFLQCIDVFMRCFQVHDCISEYHRRVGVIATLCLIQ